MRRRRSSYIRHAQRVRRTVVWTLASIVLAAAALPGRAQTVTAAAAATANTAEPVCSSQDRSIAKRELWTAGESRFLRHWLMLGPVPGELTADADGAASTAAPAAGQRQAFPAGRTLAWAPQASWGDIVDVALLLTTAAYRGSHAAPERVYAFGLLHCERAADAVLSLASDSGLRVWLNGVPIGAQSGQRTLRLDQERVPMHLEKGDNRLLLALAHASGPWRFAARLLAPGQALPPRDELTPAVTAGADGSLSVRTDDDPDVAGAPVHVAAVAPGGEILAQSDAPRGASVQLSTSPWPDGPYEIRLTTRSPWGNETVTHVPGYKGDARLAAQHLLEAERRPEPGIPQATLHMLADMVRDRLGPKPLAAPDDAWPQVHSALMEQTELQQQAAGKAGAVRPYGFVRLAYNDDIDGSAQFCRAYLPPRYTAGQRWPLIIMLHGFNPDNPPYVRWWDVDKRHDPTAERHGVIFVEPLGRGNTQYQGIGEQDVMRCLAQAKERFSVDADRVYLTGESMGGEGTWLIASHHPELFAAAAPIFGGWDYRIFPGAGLDNPHADQLPERYVAESQSSFAGAESLLQLPLLVTHGDSDQAVPVMFSQFASSMLQRWSYDLRYQEIPGRGHEDLKLRDRIADWLLEHRRSQAPREVRVRSLQLDNAAAYWVKVEAFEEPLQLIEVDAEVLRPGLVRLDTRNVAAVRLALPVDLRGAAPLSIVWNGTAVAAAPQPDGTILLEAPGEKLSPGDKHPGLAGGLSDLITTPFVIVVGTASTDARMRELCRRKARALAERWASWQHVMPRLLRDDELAATDAARYSLLLIGGADANLVTRRLAVKLPLQVESSYVTIGGKRFAAHDAAVEMIYPSPLAPGRYVSVVAATSTDGMYFWDPAGLWQMPFGYATQALDWTIRDGRLVSLEEGLGSHRGAVVSGVFDRHWRLDERYILPGDAALRAASPLRHPPLPAARRSPQALSAYAGLYALLSGVNIRVAPSGPDLIVSSSDGQRYVLHPESGDLFTVGDTGIVAVFSRDAQGRVSALTVNQGGQLSPAQRLQ